MSSALFGACLGMVFWSATALVRARRLHDKVDRALAESYNVLAQAADCVEVYRQGDFTAGFTDGFDAGVAVAEGRIRHGSMADRAAADYQIWRAQLSAAGPDA